MVDDRVVMQNDVMALSDGELLAEFQKPVYQENEIDTVWAIIVMREGIRRILHKLINKGL